MSIEVDVQTEFHQKGKFDSWEVISENVIKKTCDLSFFKYRGSGVPIQIRWFFDAEELKSGDKKDIILIYRENEYPAYISRSKSTSEVTRIFWNTDLETCFKEYDIPENYPICKFLKKSGEKYEVTFEKTTDIDYLWILKYLEENREIPYKDPNKPGLTQEEREGFLAVKANGQKVVAELKKIHALCSEKFNLGKCEKVSWDDGSHTKTKGYLWVPMKYMEYADRQESISVFVELADENTTRFRVSLELRNDKADAKDVKNYHKHLELPLDKKASLIYVAGSNEFGCPARIYEEQNIIAKKVSNKEYSKVQICRYIDKSDFTTNEQIENAIFSAINALLPYYDYVLGVNKNTYWPSLEEYDPGITAEKWIELLLDPKIGNDETLRMLYRMLDLGGESTCANLAECFGGSAAAYNSRGRSLGEHVYKATGCLLCKDGEVERFYTIPFVGRSVEEKGFNRYSWKLRDELKEALESDMMIDKMNVIKSSKKDVKYAKNMILYGPPGTGKTYNSAIYAVAICDGKDVKELTDYEAVMERYEELKKEKRIAFTTFHQSYGYEEFIEGIKPVVDNSKGELAYRIEDGLFKAFCKKAALPVNDGIDPESKVWKITLNKPGDNDLKRECFSDGTIKFDWKKLEELEDTQDFYLVRQFKEKLKIGDIVVSYYGNKTEIDGVGIVTGNAVYDESRENFQWSRSVEWVYIGAPISIQKLNDNKWFAGDKIYELERVDIKELFDLVCPQSNEPKDENIVFIIDEINRGNISKIFGELITLIEETKREGMPEAVSATLPYSGESFSVPANVYILGTMNTADRSIQLMDTALRRRFSFVEMMPKSKVLSDMGIGQMDFDGTMLNVAGMLDAINDRIAFLFDREHTIGHAFFTGLKDDPTIEKLASIFEKSVIPLLQEYFYEDYQKIQLVLGDNAKTDPNTKFIIDKKVELKNLFMGSVEDLVDEKEVKYEINLDAFRNINAYKTIAKGI